MCCSGGLDSLLHGTRPSRLCAWPHKATQRSSGLRHRPEIPHTIIGNETYKSEFQVSTETQAPELGKLGAQQNIKGPKVLFSHDVHKILLKILSFFPIQYNENLGITIPVKN